MTPTAGGRQRLGFRRLIPYLKQHKLRLAAGLALTPVFTSIALYTPQVIRRAIESLRDAGGEGLDPELWTRILLVLLGLWALYGLVRFAARYLLIGLSRIVEEMLRNDFFEHLSRCPARYFDQARIGDLISRSAQDIELMRFMAGPTLFFGAATLIQLPLALLLVFSISVVLGITVLGLFGIIALGLRFLFPKLALLSRSVQDVQGDLSAKAQEDFTGIRVLQAFAREDFEVRAFAGLADHCLDAQVSMAKYRGMLHATFIISGYAGQLAVLSAGVFVGLTIAELFTALLYLRQLVWPMIIIGWVMQTYHRAKAAADRIDEVFVVATEEEECPVSAGPLPELLETSLEARELSFRYGGDSPLALDSVNFRIEANQTLGLVGPIGGGKSTLIALLARLYNPARGTLFIGQTDVLDLRLEDLRKHLSIAPQDPFLFSDSIQDNILFSTAHEPKEELLEEVIHASGLEPDIETFPEGLDQFIGERGLTLSGGQKQRTSLARALAGDRPVLILDDTLSAVDHGTEQSILGSLGERRGKQTTILIAHRLEAVRGADLILVLDQGRVVERGRHPELVRAGGWYARTWAQQQRVDAT
ncbi:MAG: ABC transporter ATP-binding protein [Planctomycetota bacterium]